MLFNGHNQAKKVCILKTISRREWKNQPGGAGFSPRRPYCCPLPSPVSLSLFSFPSRPLHICIIYRCICIYVYTYIFPSSLVPSFTFIDHCHFLFSWSFRDLFQFPLLSLLFSFVILLFRKILRIFFPVVSNSHSYVLLCVSRILNLSIFLPRSF